MNDNSSATSASVWIKGALKEDSKGGLGVDDEGLSVDASAMSAFRDQHTEASNNDGPINFLKDDIREMTYGRRIALSLMDKKWYNPRAGEIDINNPGTQEFTENGSPKRSSERKQLEQPNLAKAWAYFEHVALDRFIVQPKTGPPTKGTFKRAYRRVFMKGDKKLDKAEPGENDVKTLLYRPLWTPHAQLGDFGLGIGLYFATLRAITVITFVAGLISIYNIVYFASDDYISAEFREEIAWLIQGSAVCTMTSWVPCPECDCVVEKLRSRDATDVLFGDRCGIAEEMDAPGNNFTVALRNDCDATVWQLGAVNYAAVIFLLLSVGYLGYYLKQQEIQFDEDEQTAQDYAIRVNNPPSDAKDPEEWRRFFEDAFEGSHVTVITVAVDNDILVRTLVERRELLRTIENGLEPGTSMSNLNLAYLAAEEERGRGFFATVLAKLAPGLPENYARVVALNAKVQGLAQLDFPATNVFVIFETETDQRRALEKLSVGSLSAHNNNTTAVSDPKYLFRGRHVLSVSEPDEPSAIRWEDLNAGFLQKLKEQALTILCTLGAIIGVAAVVNIANEASTLGAAIAISGFNSVFPIFAKMLTSVESHASEGEKQTSLYFKIAAFRWVNTAIVITIITPFTNTLTVTDGLIPQIYTLFFAEIVTTNAIQLADPVGHLNRHFMAPRAATQDAMNLLFQGEEVELAERYTDMTKILFLCLWYCSIYPGAFFMCSFALLIKYFVDRFSLMRTWKRPPRLGTRVSQFSRRYFFSLACVAMAIISSFYWSGFPFDNICPNESIDDSYLGTFTVTSLDNTTAVGEEVTFTENDVDYRFCLQDFLTPGTGRTFPFVPDNQPEGGEWMTEDQENITLIFGWSAVAITGIVVLKFLWGWVSMVQNLFYSSYKSVGDDQNQPFSTVASRNAYIPEVISRLFPYPLIACNSDPIDEELYEWSDPDRPYAFYDLSKDAERLLKGTDIKENVGFSIVKHWPPGGSDEAEEDEFHDTLNVPQLFFE